MGFGSLTLKDGAGEIPNIKNMSDLVNLIIALVFNIGLAVALLFVIVGGIKIATSNGDPNKFEEGKNTVINAIIGALIIIGFKVLVNFILGILGAPSIEKYLIQTP